MLQVVDRNGEIIQDCKIITDRANVMYQNNVAKLVFNEKGEAALDNAQCYSELHVDPKDTKTGDIFTGNDGEVYISLVGDARVFSKLYQGCVAVFSKTIYEAYWYRLICHLRYKTNAIYIRESDNTIRYAENRQDLMNICGIEERAFRDFYKECRNRFYIAELHIGDTKKGTILYVVNPAYSLNGSILLYSVYCLFAEAELGISIDKNQLVGELQRNIIETEKSP